MYSHMGRLIIYIRIMKYLIILIVSFFPISGFAQRTVVDSVDYLFNYAIKFSTIEEIRPHDDEIVVEIGKHRTLCYGYWDETNSLVLDSIKSHGGTIADYLALGNPVGWFDYHILKNYPKKGELTVTQYEGKKFIYTEPIAEKKWKLEEGDTTILDYACKKASCTFRNRTWNVWYSLDIPIPEGPWKLDGLPGMILMAADTQNRFSFECINIKKGVNKPMSIKLDKRIKTTGAYIERLCKLKQQNREAYRKATGEANNDSSPHKYSPSTACLLEYYEPNKK